MERVFCCQHRPLLHHDKNEKHIKTIQIQSKRIHFYKYKNYIYLKFISDRTLYIVDLAEIFLNGAMLSGIISKKHDCNQCRICEKKRFSVNLHGVFTTMNFSPDGISVTCQENRKMMLHINSAQLMYILKHIYDLYKNHFLKNSKTFQIENNRIVLNQMIENIHEIWAAKEGLGELHRLSFT